MNFKNYNSLYTKLCRSAKQLFYRNKFTEYSGDSKKTWQMINKVLGRKHDKSSIPNTFFSNDKVLSGVIEIAEGFNTFFL